MPSPIPPGLPHVLRIIGHLSVPIVLVYICAHLVRIPTWAFILLEICSLPVYVTARIWIRDLRQRVAARHHGAVLPPRHDGKYFGNVDLLRKFQRIYKRGYLGDGVSEAHNELGGTFTLRILWDMNIISNDANVIKTMLATEFSNYVKGDFFQGFMYSVLGTGVFNTDGEMWKFHRSMTRPFFSRDRISHFDIFEKYSDEAINKLRVRLREGQAVDFQDLISRFTLDSASEFLFGACINSLESELPCPHQYTTAQEDQEVTPADRFARAFSRAQDIIAARGRIGYIWPFMEIFSDKTEKDMEIVDSFLNPILEQAVENQKKEKAAGLWKDVNAEEVGDDETFLDHLVRTTTDPQILHDEILNIMIAGRDTTAATLTFAIYFLSIYPHTMERLRKEVLETVGPSRRPGYDDIKDMKYLRAFLNEVLRLYPAVPFNVRYSVEDTTVPNPDPNGQAFFVPAGTPITYSVLLMHRRKDYWGEDAHEFDPDRFLDDRVQYLLANPFIFLPFNAGPRICLGQQFAYNEMSFFLVRLLQNFSSVDLQLDCQDPATLPPKEWAKCSGRKGIEKFFPKSHLTAYAYGGMWVKMKEAEPTETI